MMKKEIIATLCLSLVGLAASGQVNRTNYVKRITMLDSIANDRNITVQYYDGFCRPSQVPEEIKDNEVTRTDHSGYRFRMESVTSNTPIEKEQEFVIYPQKDEK